jgi:DNA mismatch repair ATPase MutS
MIRREHRAFQRVLFDATDPGAAQHYCHRLCSTVMNSLFKAFNPRDLRLSESIVASVRLAQRSPATRRWRLPREFISQCMRRGAKTTTRRKIKDLQQGAIQGEPLPEFEEEDVSQQAQYPSVLQGVRDNMVKFPNCVVITRVGNFYELYFDHAEEFAPLLNIKLTHRTSPRHPPVAMAGFPFWQLDRYLKVFVQDHNRHVAISEESPINPADKTKSNGPMFSRAVRRIVTPGTLIDEKFLEPYQNNFLLSVHAGQQPDSPQSNEQDRSHDEVGLAWIDLSTGDFCTQTTSRSLVGSALARIGAREIILPHDGAEDLKTEVQAIVGQHHDSVTLHKCKLPFESMAEWNETLETQLPADAEGRFTNTEKLAMHQILDYVRFSLQGTELHLQPPRQRDIHQYLSIDRHSLRGLEILETARDGLGKGSLYHAVRRTVTKSGARLLRDRLTSPSASAPEINERLDLVATLISSHDLRDSLVQRLKRTYDVQRIVQKFTLNKGDADDMLCLAKAVDETAAAYDLLQTIVQARNGSSSEPIDHLLNRFDLEGPLELGRAILQAIDEEGLNQMHRQEEDEAADVAAQAVDVVQNDAPEDTSLVPKSARVKARLGESRFSDPDMLEVWIMRRDASDTVQRLHERLDELKINKSELEKRLQEELTTPNLTLRWTPGLGHICHVRSITASTTKKLEELNARMVSSSKTTRSFYLTEWSRLGAQIDQARLNIRHEEQRLFRELRRHVINNLVKLRRNAAVMDELDVASSFASLAQEQAWVRPKVNATTSHMIIGGRHPTVKLGLEEQGRTFVSNDLILDESEQTWLVTGPNMAGKSTFLRQNALITILAQVGSYVPAEHAEIGLVDQIFSRIGAADDLFRDQSTFMVEMLETAAILKQATPRSFVIMDEVGRGTTPQDGTAVAYGSLLHLHTINKCRTLFATHFHALADLTTEWPRLGTYCTDILEDERGSFTFQHRLRPGVNRQSHALKVAALAGLPAPALEAATAVLRQLHGDKDNQQGEQEYHDSTDTRQPLAAAG